MDENIDLKPDTDNQSLFIAAGVFVLILVIALGIFGYFYLEEDPILENIGISFKKPTTVSNLKNSDETISTALGPAPGPAPGPMSAVQEIIQIAKENTENSGTNESPVVNEESQIDNGEPPDTQDSQIDNGEPPDTQDSLIDNEESLIQEDPQVDTESEIEYEEPTDETDTELEGREDTIYSDEVEGVGTPSSALVDYNQPIFSNLMISRNI